MCISRMRKVWKRKCMNTTNKDGKKPAIVTIKSGNNGAGKSNQLELIRIRIKSTDRHIYEERESDVQTYSAVKTMKTESTGLVEAMKDLMQSIEYIRTEWYRELWLTQRSMNGKHDVFIWLTLFLHIPHPLVRRKMPLVTVKCYQTVTKLKLQTNILNRPIRWWLRQKSLKNDEWNRETETSYENNVKHDTVTFIESSDMNFRNSSMAHGVCVYFNFEISFPLERASERWKRI